VSDDLRLGPRPLDEEDARRADLEQRIGEVQDKAGELAHGAAERAFDSRRRFLECMRRYGTYYATAKATPTEIAEAGLAECQLLLDDFERERQEYHAKRAHAAQIPASETYNAIDDMAADRARVETADLATVGRRAAIRAVIEMQRRADPDRPDFRRVAEEDNKEAQRRLQGPPTDV
jgi:hypothetical protein